MSRVDGTPRSPRHVRGARDGVVASPALLDGRARLRSCPVRPCDERVDPQAPSSACGTGEIRRALSPRTFRGCLAGTIALELAYAARCSTTCSVSPEPTGRARRTYVYRMRASPACDGYAGSDGEGDHTLGWIVLGPTWVAGVPAVCAIWASLCTRPTTSVHPDHPTDGDRRAADPACARVIAVRALARVIPITRGTRHMRPLGNTTARRRCPRRRRGSLATQRGVGAAVGGARPILGAVSHRGPPLQSSTSPCRRLLYRRARVTDAGEVLDWRGGVAIETAGLAQNGPSAAYGSANYLVAWQDSRTDVGDIDRARVSQAGVVLPSVARRRVPRVIGMTPARALTAITPAQCRGRSHSHYVIAAVPVGVIRQSPRARCRPSQRREGDTRRRPPVQRLRLSPDDGRGRHACNQHQPEHDPAEKCDPLLRLNRR